MFLRQPFGSAYLDASPLDEFITRQWPAVTACTVIKAHEIGPAALAALRAGDARAVYTYRDPRDCVASDLAFMRHSFDTCLQRVCRSLEPLLIYRTIPGILLVRYEEMMGDRCREIRRIANHLGLPLEEATVRKIDSKTDLQSSRAISASLKDRPPETVRLFEGHRIDPATQLHDNHFNGGTIGRWRSELTTDQIIRTTEVFAPWLESLGYDNSVTGPI